MHWFQTLPSRTANVITDRNLRARATVFACAAIASFGFVSGTLKAREVSDQAGLREILADLASGRNVSARVSLPVKRQAIGTPDRHRKGTPHRRWGRLVPVANRRVPRASRSALTSDGAARVGGACLPTGASRGGTQARFLNRQLSLPVSMISQ